MKRLILAASLASVATLLAGCGGGATAEVPPTTLPTLSASSAPPTSDDTFAQESGLNGAALTSGIEYAKAMCKRLGDWSLLGDASREARNGAWNGWVVDDMEFPYKTATVEQWTSVRALAIASAVGYCPEFEQEATDFWAKYA